MKEGPELSRVAALVGDPARANMLSALMDGGALTASELALEAGVLAPTASSHLSKLAEGGLLRIASQGRHRYYALSSPQVAAMLEAIMGVAALSGPTRSRPGPRDADMREARICYDHLAGTLGVAFYDSLVRRAFICEDGDNVALSAAGEHWFAGIGIALPAQSRSRRPLCKACLDWSVRRSHLAGRLGAATLDHVIAKGWARRVPSSRVIRFSAAGRRAFDAVLDA